MGVLKTKLIRYNTRMVFPDIRTVSDLESYLQEHSLTWDEAGLPLPQLMEKHFSLLLPRFYADLIDWKNSLDPLRRMVIPEESEQKTEKYELIDPIGDHTHEPVPGLIHRYPDRCLLLLTTHCSVHCRFCFRRDVIGTPLPMDIEGIEKYLQTHEEIHEVIFTGGDPATLPPAFLRAMTDRLFKIVHIDTYRFHTRSLVVNPHCVGDEWFAQLGRLQGKKKIVVLHVNHPREVTPELRQLVHTLRDMNVRVLSQSVLLKGINDSAEILRELFITLSAADILPYYLHHLDKARGTHHFRLSIEQGKKLFSAVRGTISGHSLPEYVVDLPGGDGKVPVMWLRRHQVGVYEVENYEGKTIQYIDPVETV